MAIHYPFTYTLEDGIQVEVNNAGTDSYDFTLTSNDGDERHFTIVDNVRKDQVTESLDFDQLNAVRRFWLEQEKEKD